MHKNNNNIVNVEAAKASPLKRFQATLALAAFTVVCAFATDPAPNDYTDAITEFKTGITGFLTTNMGAMLAILVVVLAPGIVWKLLKRAGKSI